MVARPSYDRDSWEERWSRALHEQGDRVAQRPPNAHLVAQVGDLPPGRALDAGCGHGSEALWLAARGWRVTAVDFATTALSYGRAAAEALGPEIAERVNWVEGDLGTLTPPSGDYDLVICLFVHVAGSVDEFVRRMASGVSPGGTLLMAGYRADEAETAAPGQVQVSVEEARAALDADEWETIVADERPRTHGPSGVDAVIRARRLPSA